MRYLLLVPLFFFGSVILSCQNAKSDQTPTAVEKAFQEKYPGENDPDWRIDDHGNYECHFKKDGVKYRADFSPEGSWIETETSIKMKELPKAIRKAINRTYVLYTIAELEKVDHHSKGIFYDVEFKLKGKNKDVEFREDGTVLCE